ncbi:hypothetical protein DFH06DRAFT_1132107 [Mycena polygramma]|nr:hypothetical protein DFH06DRAFT_1132107 [Mycena polygramma]
MIGNPGLGDVDDVVVFASVWGDCRLSWVAERYSLCKGAVALRLSRREGAEVSAKRGRAREAPAKACPQKVPDFDLKNPIFCRRLALKNPISDKDPTSDGVQKHHFRLVFRFQNTVFCRFGWVYDARAVRRGTQFVPRGIARVVGAKQLVLGTALLLAVRLSVVKIHWCGLGASWVRQPGTKRQLEDQMKIMIDAEQSSYRRRRRRTLRKKANFSGQRGF